MKHGKNTLRLTALLTAALMLLLTLCGCSRGMIKEDSVHEDLPDIDPEAGIAKDMRAKLYYRLTDEAYLVGVTATITVYAGEREERAMIRTAGNVPCAKACRAVHSEHYNREQAGRERAAFV